MFVIPEIQPKYSDILQETGWPGTQVPAREG